MSRVRSWWSARVTVIVPWWVQAWATIAAAGYAISRGVAYLPFAAPEKLPGALAYLTEFTGLTGWAVAWLLAAAGCGLALWTRRPTWVIGVAAMAFGWGLSYGIAWIRALTAGETSRDYLNGGSYLFPAALLALWIIASQPPKTPPSTSGDPDLEAG